MSTSKVDTSGVFEPISAERLEARLSLPAAAVRFCKNGIEFSSEHPIANWTELTVDVETPEGGKVRGTGVVVACEGSPQTGFSVHLAFLSLTPQSQASLSFLAYA
ncbi:MAG: hypothetical protein AB1705_05190 [Verrucomicrobiota bacterium]